MGRGRKLEAAPLGHTACVLLSMLALLVALPAVSAPAASAAGGGEGTWLAALALPSPLARLGAGVPAPSSPAAGGRVRTRLRKQAVGVSATNPHWACPEGACQAIVDPTSHAIAAHRLASGAIARFALPAGGSLEGKALEGEGEGGGYDPRDLQSAYKVPASGGSDQTVALVDAYGYPEAEADLAHYRERYGLAPCTKADGCFRKVNQSGKEDGYPAANEGWETETALDIEMVSAVCPECHILLVEASSAAGGDLSASDETAARLGATEISNSWGGPEQSCGEGLCKEEQADFEHTGVMITAAGGDNGYDNYQLRAHSPEFPASLPNVVAVGGTALHRAANARGWSEEAWVGGGSGCSRFAKPAWQIDAACAGRMTDDVAADAACETPVSVYNLHEWSLVCGTSVSMGGLRDVPTGAAHLASIFRAP